MLTVPVRSLFVSVTADSVADAEGKYQVFFLRMRFISADDVSENSQRIEPTKKPGATNRRVPALSTVSPYRPGLPSRAVGEAVSALTATHGGSGAG